MSMLDYLEDKDEAEGYRDPGEFYNKSDLLSDCIAGLKGKSTPDSVRNSAAAELRRRGWTSKQINDAIDYD